MRPQARRWSTGGGVGRPRQAGGAGWHSTGARAERAPRRGRGRPGWGGGGAAVHAEPLTSLRAAAPAPCPASEAAPRAPAPGPSTQDPHKTREPRCRDPALPGNKKSLAYWPPRQLATRPVKRAAIGRRAGFRARWQVPARGPFGGSPRASAVRTARAAPPLQAVNGPPREAGQTQRGGGKQEGTHLRIRKTPCEASGSLLTVALAAL